MLFFLEKKILVVLPHDTAIPLLGINLKENVNLSEISVTKNKQTKKKTPV